MLTASEALGGLCQTPLLVSGASPRLPRPLHPASSSLEQSHPRSCGDGRGSAGYLLLPRPKAWQPGSHQDASGGRVHPPLPAAHPAQGLHAHSPLWLPGQPLAPAQARPLPKTLRPATAATARQKICSPVDARSHRLGSGALPSLSPWHSGQSRTATGYLCLFSVGTTIGLIMIIFGQQKLSLPGATGPHLGSLPQSALGTMFNLGPPLLLAPAPSGRHQSWPPIAVIPLLILMRAALGHLQHLGAATFSLYNPHRTR